MEWNIKKPRSGYLLPEELQIPHIDFLITIPLLTQLSEAGFLLSVAALLKRDFTTAEYLQSICLSEYDSYSVSHKFLDTIDVLTYLTVDLQSTTGS